MIRPLLAAFALAAGTLAASPLTAHAQFAAPALRAHVTVSGEVVHIGDMVENAGSAAGIAIYRAPDLGTTGRLPVAEVVATLRAHQVFGLDTRDLSEVEVTRTARLVTRAEIETAIAQALAGRHGVGEARDLAVTFDRTPDTLTLDATYNGSLKVAALRFDPTRRRFDANLEIAGSPGTVPARLRFSGAAVEMIETATVTRDVERGDILRASDVALERRPRAEVGKDALDRAPVIGMQMKRGLRSGAVLRLADLAKPDLVQRGQSVTLVYHGAGITLTIRGKALDSGTEGDTVTVLNLQSKREVQGTVVGTGQVSATPAPPRLGPAAARTALLTAE
ncbi:MAG: flagellar basal body P-ring formation chaperone FlgA [Xanthobacteraceae bacterium]